MPDCIDNLIAPSRARTEAWASPAVVSQLYARLRELAAGRLRKERRDHTLQPTALANEAYLRLVRHRDLNPENPAEFVAAAVQEIRRILVDHARSRGRQKRGGELAKHPLTSSLPAPPVSADPVDLDAVLSRLESVSPRAATVVQMRFYAGLSNTETAALLEVNPRTTERDWHFARAWLYRELNGDPLPGGDAHVSEPKA